MKREFKDLVLSEQRCGNRSSTFRIEQGLLADQYKAVLPLSGYYQFIDNYMTPSYLLDIVAARE